AGSSAISRALRRASASELPVIRRHISAHSARIVQIVPQSSRLCMRPMSATLVVALAVVFVLTSGCSTRTDVRKSLEQTVRTADNGTKILADYQPWFGDRNHIDVGYSTQDPNVLRKQIQKAKDIGIYGFAVDWYGDRQPFLDRSYALLQQ